MQIERKSMVRLKQYRISYVCTFEYFHIIQSTYLSNDRREKYRVKIFPFSFFFVRKHLSELFFSLVKTSSRL